MFTAYVINLNYRTDRLQEFYQQQDAHYFQRVPAIDKAMLNLSVYGQLNYVFDTARCKQLIGREVTAGEVACCLSHIKCWHLVAENPNLTDDDFAIIAEDDVRLCPDFAKNIQCLFEDMQQQPDYDVFLLQRLFWENIVDLSLATQKVNKLYFLSSPDKKFFDFKGTSLYAMRKSRAIELVAYLSKYKPYWLADHLSCLYDVDKICTVSPLFGVIPDGIEADSDLEAEREMARYQAMQQTDYQGRGI